MDVLGPRTTLKIIVLGDKAVGKSTLINALLEEDGSESSRIYTIGNLYNDMVHYEIDTEEYGAVQLSVWDTVGEDYGDEIAKNIYRGANGIILLYDVTNRESFTRITERWLPRVRSILGDGGLGDDMDVADIMQRDEIFKILIVANKVDVVGQRRVVSTEEAKALTQSYKLPFLQLSTISDEHKTIKLPFILLTSLLMPFFVTRRTTSRLHLDSNNTTKYTDDSTTCC